MTEAERIEWGMAESSARKSDIEAVKAGMITLEEAQKRARHRTRQSGMAPSEAHAALCDGQRAIRDHQ